MSIKPINFNFLCLLLIIAAGVFYSVIWRNAPFVADDTSGYIEVVKDIRDGKLDELHDRTPGYPILLLVTNSSTPTSILFLTQLSLYLLSVFILVFYLNEIGISKQFALLFLLLSLIPPSVVNTVYMLTETATIFFIVTGVVSLLWWFKNSNTLAILLSGLAFSFSALVRPTYQFLFVMLIFLLLISLLFFRDKRKIIFAVLSIFLSSCLVLGGFSLYNRQHFNYFGITPMLGFNLSTKTVRVIERLPDQYKDVRELLISSRDSDLIERNSSHTGVMFIWQTIPSLKRLTGLNKVDLSNYMLRLNLLLIREAPLEYIVEVTRSMSTYWLPSSTDVSNFNSRIIQLLWTIMHFAVVTVFFSVSLLFFSLLVFVWRFPIEIKKRITDLIKPFYHLSLPFFASISIIIYTMLISTMVEVGNPRYRTPTDLLMFFALAIGGYFVSQVGFQSKSGG